VFSKNGSKWAAVGFKFFLSHLLRPHWSWKTWRAILYLLSVFQVVCILFGENVWNNFREAVHGTKQVEKHYCKWFYFFFGQLSSRWGPLHSLALQVTSMEISLCKEYKGYWCLNRSRGSSVSIVSDYGLDDRAIEVRSPTGADFLASASRPALGPTQPLIQWLPGVERGRGVTLTTHLHLVPRLRMSRSYTSSPPHVYHGV
jgi:hypothetical protein